MICFYHSADLDGHCSGAIVKYFNPDCELYGINYGDEFPWEKVQGQDVVMVDFSLQPFSDMLRLRREARDFSWIDHHKTAIAEYYDAGLGEGNIQNAILDAEFAACELTWKYFSSDELPQSVFWLGRYDIWKHSECPGSLEFQYGIRMYDTNPANQQFWTMLFRDGAGYDTALTLRIRNEGSLLLAYETMQNEKFAKAFSFETELDGLRCIAVNKGFTNSLIFESVYDPAKHDAMLSFCWRGGKWTISLYSTKEGVDCGAICKARGGGGHKGAAGFQCRTEDFPFRLPTVNSREEPK